MAGEVLLVVFFEGTANTIYPPTTQVGVFAAAVDAVDLSQQGGETKKVSEELVRVHSAFKLAFDGCGVTNGLKGTLFAAGLDQQCALVVDTVEQLVSALSDGVRVRVVAVGLSRGGLACARLAPLLARTNSAARLSLSMLLFDPVPGDMLCTGFPFTGVGAKDLSMCTNLVRVLALYPHEPLPDVALHAPLLCRYGKGTEVEEDVTLGCHQGALFGTRPSATRHMDVASNLSFRRILDFLNSEGVSCTFAPNIHVPASEECLQLCRAALREDFPTRRAVHDGTGASRVIVRGSKATASAFLNRHHEQLESSLGDKESPSEPLPDRRFMLDFEAPPPLFSRLFSSS